MASSYMELYSDFRDDIKAYVQELDVTELSFMRRLTKGMQQFQQETEYVKLIEEVVANEHGHFYLPYDIKRIIKIIWDGHEDVQFVPNGFTQLAENIARGDRKEEIRSNYLINKPYNTQVVLFSDYNGFLVFDTKIPADATLRVFCVPDISPISDSGWLWNIPDDTTVTPTIYKSWYPLNEIITVNGKQTSRFSYMMETNQMPRSMSLYESNILDYAISGYIKSKGSVNYKVYEEKFYTGISRAKAHEVSYFSNGVADYNFAHKS